MNALAERYPSVSVNQERRSDPLAGSTISALRKRNGGSDVSSAPINFAESVSKALLELKVAAAHFAMYLTEEQRHDIFVQLDDIINVEDWYEGDRFPSVSAFKDLLAWLVYAQAPDWTSLGVADDGNVLIAWHSTDVTLTGSFDGLRLVRWTARYRSEDDVTAHAAGDCSLRQFAKQANFYLQHFVTDPVTDD